MTRPATAHWTGTGYFDYARPDPADISMPDLARRLSRIPRFGGATGTAYSVAHHLLLCNRLAAAAGAPPEARAHVILHDCHEGILGIDAASPLKLLPEMAGLRILEERIDAAIYAAVDLARPTPLEREFVKSIDLRALGIEKAHLIGRRAGAWNGIEELDPLLHPLPELHIGPETAELELLRLLRAVLRGELT